jgi:hypothetical protein
MACCRTFASLALSTALVATSVIIVDLPRSRAQAHAKPICFIGKDGRAVFGLTTVAVVLIEPESSRTGFANLGRTTGLTRGYSENQFSNELRGR